jgi:hypothetical protein
MQTVVKIRFRLIQFEPPFGTRRLPPCTHSGSQSGASPAPSSRGMGRCILVALLVKPCQYDLAQLLLALFGCIGGSVSHGCPPKSTKFSPPQYSDSFHLFCRKDTFHSGQFFDRVASHLGVAATPFNHPAYCVPAWRPHTDEQDVCKAVRCAAVTEHTCNSLCFSSLPAHVVAPGDERQVATWTLPFQ